MKIDQLWKAQSLVAEHGKLMKAHEAASAGTIGVTIAGTYQDDDIVKAASPVVAAEFAKRIADVEAELTALGVDLG